MCTVNAVDYQFSLTAWRRDGAGGGETERGWGGGVSVRKVGGRDRVRGEEAQYEFEGGGERRSISS